MADDRCGFDLMNSSSIFSQKPGKSRRISQCHTPNLVPYRLQRRFLEFPILYARLAHDQPLALRNATRSEPLLDGFVVVEVGQVKGYVTLPGG